MWSSKLTSQWDIIIFGRRYIFKFLFSHGHFSCQLSHEPIIPFHDSNHLYLMDVSLSWKQPKVGFFCKFSTKKQRLEGVAACVWSNYSDLTRPGPPNGGLVREMGPRISGKSIGWWNIMNHLARCVFFSQARATRFLLQTCEHWLQDGCPARTWLRLLVSIERLGRLGELGVMMNEEILPQMHVDLKRWENGKMNEATKQGEK